jgi:hypothetical protein
MSTGRGAHSPADALAIVPVDHHPKSLGGSALPSHWRATYRIPAKESIRHTQKVIPMNFHALNSSTNVHVLISRGTDFPTGAGK